MIFRWEIMLRYVMVIFRWGTHLYLLLFPSVRCASYIRNRTSSNHGFWYTCVKWWYLQAFFFFFFFFFFWIFFFWVFWGLKGQKIAQNEKQQLHPPRATSREHYSLWSWFWVHLCKMMISPGVFLIFLKFSFSLWG